MNVKVASSSLTFVGGKNGILIHIYIYLYVHKSIGLSWINFFTYIYTWLFLWYTMVYTKYDIDFLALNQVVWFDVFCCCFMCCIWAMLRCCSRLGLVETRVDTVQVPNHSFILPKLVSSLVYSLYDIYCCLDSLSLGKPNICNML